MKRLALFMCIVMLIGMLPIASFAIKAIDESRSFSDMPNDWSTAALHSAVDNKLLVGFDGKLMPNGQLTRAEMATIITRAFKASVKGDIKHFSDVKPTDWFADYLAISYKMGIIKGSAGLMKPNDAITREEVFAIITRAFKLKPTDRINKTFSDLDDISDWAKEEVYALVNAGYIQGAYGKLNPKGLITRAEFAQVMYNIVKHYISAPGEIASVLDGNVMINVPGIDLKDTTINGDLIISDGVGEGEIILDNVKVTGRIVVREEGVNSIIIRGASDISNIIVARMDGAVSIRVQGDAKVEIIYVDDGSNDVNIQGSVGNVEIIAPDITVNANGASIGHVDVLGKNSKLIIDEDSSINRINVLNDATNAIIEVAGTVSDIFTTATRTIVKGTGSVVRVEAQSGASNTRIETPNTEITVADNVTGVAGGGRTPIASGTTETNNALGDDIVREPEDEDEEETPLEEDTLPDEEMPPKEETPSKDYTPPADDDTPPYTPPVLSVNAISITIDIDVAASVDNNAVVEVTLTTATAGADIYYTVDGSTPAVNPVNRYVGAFTVSTSKDEGETITVKAIGVKARYKNSIIASKEITFKAKDQEVAFLNLSVNGTSGSVTTTELTLYFDREISGLLAEDIIVTGANKGTLTGGNTGVYKLGISNITVANGENVNIKIFKAGYKFTPGNKDVVVNIAVADIVINITAIEGVTPPVADETPVTSITGTAQYTGTVSWSPAIVGDKFAAGTDYEAIITLTPKAGYTLIGVTENFFTVAGATTTNIANSGIITAVFPATESLEFAGGDGTPGNPYQVASAEHLNNVRNHLDKYFIQTDDIDLKSYLNVDAEDYNGGAGWIPIGERFYEGIPKKPNFTGNYNGGGFTISNLMINSPSSYVGLFGESTGTISNLSLTGADVKGKNYVGGLMGSNHGGTVTNCNVTGDVGFYEEYGSYIGGLIGVIKGGSVSRCYSKGTVSAKNGINVGGLIGKIEEGFSSDVIESYSASNVTGGTQVGGLVGANIPGGAGGNNITNSYATGSVSQDVSEGNTNHPQPSIGGLVGYNAGAVTNSYATGTVTGPGGSIGGLIGEEYNDTATVFNSYWDTQTSSQANSAGETGAVGYPTSAMIKDTNSVPIYVDWDFENIWQIDSNPRSYPYLKWQGDVNIPYPPVHVAGTVYDFVGGSNNLKDITVILYAAADTSFETPLGTGTTDINGNYGIDNRVANGSYVVRIEASTGKYAESMANVEVNGADITDVNITLQKEAVSTYTITYSVIGGIGGSLNASLKNGDPIASGDSVEAGSTVTFTAAVPEGYEIKQWIYNGFEIKEDTNPMVISDIGMNINMVVEFTIEKAPLSITATRADKAPTGLTNFPTENYLLNQNKVTVEQTGNIVTVSGPLAALEPYAQPGQEDSHKWVVLFVDTGEESILGMFYNGVGFTYDPDMVYYNKFGVGTGTFVQLIKAEEVINTPISFTLSKAGKADTKITISFTDIQ